MTKLGLRERQGFLKIIDADMDAIHAKVMEQIRRIWNESRQEILHTRGLDKLMERKEEIHQTISELKEELNNIEHELQSDKLTVQQTLEMGGKVNRWDEAGGAHFFGLPIKSQLDYDIVKTIQDKVDTNAPAKYLHDLGRTATRELTMAGTFEDAQKIYEDFYSLDFRRFGVDIPPRLKELADDKKQTDFMLPYTDEEQPKLEGKQPKVVNEETAFEDDGEVSED